MNAAVHTPALLFSIAKRQRTRVAFGASCALHLLLISLLLWKVSTPVHLGLEARRAPISLDLLPFANAAAAAPTTLATAAPPPAAKPKTRLTRRPRSAALPPEPSPGPPLLPAAVAAVPAEQPTPPAQPTTAIQSTSTVADAGSAASVALESSGATGADRVEPLPTEYLREVSRMIRVNLNYPWQARRDKLEGTVVVHILLARDGSVISVSLVQGASSSALDEEACNVVLRIRKFPGLPDEVLRGGREFAIDQPIRFRRA